MCVYVWFLDWWTIYEGILHLMQMVYWVLHGSDSRRRFKIFIELPLLFHSDSMTNLKEWGSFENSLLPGWWSISQEVRAFLMVFLYLRAGARITTLFHMDTDDDCKKLWTTAQLFQDLLKSNPVHSLKCFAQIKKHSI